MCPVKVCSFMLHLLFSHIPYIKNNNPQSAFALHILQNWHGRGTVDSIMTLLKPLNNTTMLTPYEQFFIHSVHQQGKLITEQVPGKQNPLFQLIIDPLTRHMLITVDQYFPYPPPNQFHLNRDTHQQQRRVCTELKYYVRPLPNVL